MSASDLLQWISWLLFIVIFVAATVRAVRNPRRATIDALLLFGDAAAVIAISLIGPLDGLQNSVLIGNVAGSLILALAYLLVRLVQDFSRVPGWVVVLAEGSLAFCIVGLFVSNPPRPLWLTAIQVAHFVGFTGYATVAFGLQASRSIGVTRRRLWAVAIGSGFLAADILAAGLSAGLPGLAVVWGIAAQMCGLGCGLGYYFGFAPPRWLRRAWQEPELRKFLGAVNLAGVHDSSAAVPELERLAAASVGGAGASIGLWNESRQTLLYASSGPLLARRYFPQSAVNLTPDHQTIELRADEMIAGRAFSRETALFSVDVAADDPEHAEIYRALHIGSVIAAPVAVSNRRIGVLSVYAERASIFAEDDIESVQLLADQVAVALENQRFLAEAARSRALEESTRLKQDFLSSAAHDLKSPLTAILAGSNFLEHRSERAPALPADVRTIKLVAGEARRLSRRIAELVDVARLESGTLVARRELVDLAQLATDACRHHHSPNHTCTVDADGPVTGSFDAARMTQLFDHLVDNAVKYSPDGGTIRITIRHDDSHAQVDVADEGIGIPAEDMGRLFERFHRGHNVDDRRFAGMGLGLYMCRGIVEQHGGTISATSHPHQGTTFSITLPLSLPAENVA